MWLTAPLRQRAGALSGAAEGFLTRWLGPGAVHFRGGRDGLVALCRAIEGFARHDDVDEETDRRFVEGAGALLGVLLIDHLEGASYAARGALHRVRLGRHGFFDPFAAVEAYKAYVAAELANGTHLAGMTRHMLGLFHGRPGARTWRRILTVEGVKPGAGLEVIDEALAVVSGLEAQRLARGLEAGEAA